MAKKGKTHTMLESTADLMSYAFSVAIWEAVGRGELTNEQLTIISNRADELLRALSRGDILENEGTKYLIRPRTPEDDEDAGTLVIGG